MLGDQIRATDDEGTIDRAAWTQLQRTVFAGEAADMIRDHRHIVTLSNHFDPRVKPGRRLRVNQPDLIQSTGNIIAIRERFRVRAPRPSAIVQVDIGPFQPGAEGVVEPTPLDPVDQLPLPEGGELPDKLYFGTRIGGRTNSPPYNPEWHGYTTNYQHDPTEQEPFAAAPDDPEGERYPEAFTVAYPEIPASELSAIKTPVAKRIVVPIPNDELVRHQ